MAQYDIVLKMWTASALIAHLWVLCLLLATCTAAPEPLWSLDQVGSKFNYIRDFLNSKTFYCNRLLQWHISLDCRTAVGRYRSSQ